MGKSNNCNKDNFRNKWDLPHGLDTNYKRYSNKKIIQKELELYEDEELNDEEVEEENDKDKLNDKL